MICLRAGGMGREQQNQKGFSLPKGRFSNRMSVFRGGAQSPFENPILGRLLYWLGRGVMGVAPHEHSSCFPPQTRLSLSLHLV